MTNFPTLSCGVSDPRGEIPASPAPSVPPSSHLVPLGKATHEAAGTGPGAALCYHCSVSLRPAWSGWGAVTREPEGSSPPPPRGRALPGRPARSFTVPSSTLPPSAHRPTQNVKLNSEASSAMWIKVPYFLLIFLPL